MKRPSDIPPREWRPLRRTLRRMEREATMSANLRGLARTLDIRIDDSPEDRRYLEGVVRDLLGRRTKKVLRKA